MTQVNTITPPVDRQTGQQNTPDWFVAKLYSYKSSW